MRSLDGLPNPFFCSALPCATPFNFASTLPQPNPFNSYSVSEKTTSFYVEGAFGGSDWSGNLGVRVVRTTTLALTAQNVPTYLWTPSVANATQTFNVGYSASQAFSQQSTYTMALPSLNLSYWVLPQTLQLRAAASETLSRPDLNQLAPNATNEGIQRGQHARLHRDRGSQAHQSVLGGFVARVVLRSARRVERRAVRQARDQRHLFWVHAQCRSWHVGVCGRTTRNTRSHADQVPLDHRCAGQRRFGDLHRCRAELAAFSRQRARHSHAVHAYVEQRS